MKLYSLDPSPLYRIIGGQRRQGTLAQQLAVQILRGELPAGHVFPSEIEFADQLGISRSALREALGVLASKGLVHGRPKAGTCVTPRRQWSLLDPDLLAWQFQAEPSPDFLRDLFELRMVIEPAAAALAAKRRTHAQIDGMAVALDEMDRLGLATEEGRMADQRFHALMIEAIDNAAIIALSSSIMAAIAWTTIFKLRRHATPRDPMPEHRALHAAIASGKAVRARKAMADLVPLALADTEVALGLG